MSCLAGREDDASEAQTTSKINFYEDEVKIGLILIEQNVETTSRISFVAMFVAHGSMTSNSNELRHSVQTPSDVVETFISGVSGMKEGGVRRVEVQPQKGWEKKSTECDGGPGGKGNGGEVKTDMMIVPTAKMVQEEMCFDKKLLPFPKSYAQERRMAQRFDQALILEIGLIKVL